MGAPVAIVVNPRSGAGRTGRKLGQLEEVARRLFGEVEIRPTLALGDGARQAREAARAGARLVIACGGDGTASEVVDGLMSLPGDRPEFGLVPGGTGSDLARTLGMPGRWDTALEAIRASAPQPTDVLRATFAGPAGEPIHRHGINVLGMGLAGDVVRRVNASRKPLGGTLTFLGATVAALLAWRPVEAEVVWTDPEGVEHVWSGKLVNVFVANGRYCGSGMCVSPDGRMDDGVLGVVIVPSLPLLRMFRELPRLYDGSLPESTSLVTGRATRVRATVRSAARAPAAGRDAVKVPSDLDGEQPGWLPVHVEVVPGALRVRAPWAPPLRPA